MNKRVRKSIIRGEITVPSSKSALQRLIVAAMLAKDESIIQFESISEDSEAVLNIAGKIGANVKIEPNCIRIRGGFSNPEVKLSVGESGLGLRMLAPVLASTAYPFEISGKGSLLSRPIDFLIESLQRTGVTVSSTYGALPITIQGPISEEIIKIDGSVGSQLVTGYLMAAPLLNKDITIIVDNLKSKPYIDLTINVLNNFGVQIQNFSYREFKIKGGQAYHSISTLCEGDWSGAAFPLVAAAISGSVVVKGLDTNSTQGDKAIVDVIKKCGAIVHESNNGINVTHSRLGAFSFDATDTPDLFPPLVALALNCNGISIIKGVSRLKHKESNRGKTLLEEFNKLGANILIDNDLMIIEGCRLTGNRVYSHHDHRIAMALAIAAINTEGEVNIENAEAVGKSWPDFFEKMSEIGVAIE